MNWFFLLVLLYIFIYFSFFWAYIYINFIIYMCFCAFCSFFSVVFPESLFCFMLILTINLCYLFKRNIQFRVDSHEKLIKTYMKRKKMCLKLFYWLLKSDNRVFIWTSIGLWALNERKRFKLLLFWQKGLFCVSLSVFWWLHAFFAQIRSLKAKLQVLNYIFTKIFIHWP